MKWFWGILLLAAVGAAVLMMRGGGGGSGASGGIESAVRPSDAPAPMALEPVPAKPSPTSESVPALPTPPSEAPVPEVDRSAATPADIGKDADATVTHIPPPKQTDIGQKADATEEAIEAKAQELNDGLSKALGLVETPAVSVPETLPATAEFVGPPAPSKTESTPAAGAPPTNAAADSAKAKLVEQPDGSVLVDDKFVVKGLGTQADPFIVSWEMLVSAQDTYQPRLGRKVIPDRLKMLSGKWVKISGFVAFPIMAASQDEMLMMLNQWDGCCIGVPPTPYDAIEVKLKSAAEGDDRLRVSGTIKGILRVDPYLIKDWLVSLYLMDDAEFLRDANAPVEKREPNAVGMHGAGAPK